MASVPIRPKTVTTDSCSSGAMTVSAQSGIDDCEYLHIVSLIFQFGLVASGECLSGTNGPAGIPLEYISAFPIKVAFEG